MSKQKDVSDNAKRAAENAKEAAAGFFSKTGEALSSPTAKEVYKAAGFAAVGATIAALTGFKLPTWK